MAWFVHILYSSTTTTSELKLTLFDMSNPADIEVAGVPDWLVEDSTPTAVVASPTRTTSFDVEDPGDNSWLVDESPTATATPVEQPPNHVIHAPSRAGRASNDLEKFHKKKSKTKTKKKEKTKEKKIRDNTTDTTENRDPRFAATIDTNTNVNNGGDNNNRTSNAEAASQKTWGQYFRESIQRDGRLMLITVGILIMMNIPFVWWVLYPFVLFDAWVHEMCHGMAAIISGGEIIKLEVFPDGSGLATITTSSRAFVSSAGYQGTAVVGFILLIFRRTKRGPRTGTMVVACAMLLSCILWMRNPFGFTFIFFMGLILGGLAWKLPSFHIRNVYVFLSTIISLNAITRVRDLYGYYYFVNGSETLTDAHTMSNLTGVSYLFWATLWMILAISMTILGILFAIPGPDEVADFTCCGVCQDFGCFKLCNYPGQRWMSRFRGNDDSNGQENNATSATGNTNSGEP